MRRFALLTTVSAAALLACLYAAPAEAQATRTWVSGVGDDANPCSRTAPCKTFAGAISKTAAGGEINCLDPGGFGGVTITKSIAIICDNTEAGVLVSGTNAIIINAGVNDIVTLKGLDIEGLGTGLNGINFLAGRALHVHKVQIRGFRGTNGNGLIFQPSGNSELYVADSYIHDNGSTGNTSGILVRPTGAGTANATINRVQLENNNNGIRFEAGGTGVVNGVVRDTLSAGNSANGIMANTGVTPAVAVMLDNVVSASNAGVGVNATGSGALVRIGRSTVTNNVTGVSSVSSGVMRTYQTNQINGNLSDGTPIPLSDGQN